MSIGLAEFASHNNIADVRRMLEQGTNVNAYYPRKGTTALMEACRHGNKEMFDLLIAHGADINLQNKYAGPEAGKTALDYAFERENSEIIDILLQNGGKTKNEFPEFVPEEQPRYAITSVMGRARAIGKAAKNHSTDDSKVSLDKKISRVIRRVGKGMEL